MSTIKQKLLNAIFTHPKLATFAIGLAITMAIGTVLGMLDHSHTAFAATSQSNVNTGGN